MNFHGKGENVIITDEFPMDISDKIICPHFPSLYNKIENGFFIGAIASTLIMPPFEYQIPETEEINNSDFVMARIEYDSVQKPKYYTTKKEEMPPSEEVQNKYGYKLFKYKSDDGRIKFFVDDIKLSKDEALVKWNLGYPLVVYINESSQPPKTYFPNHVNGKPNLFLIVLANISNMDFERIKFIKEEDVKDFLSVNGFNQYNKLKKLAQKLDEKPGFLNRKYNGFLIHNKANLQSLLLNPPPRFSLEISKWNALDKIVKMIDTHN